MRYTYTVGHQSKLSEQLGEHSFALCDHEEVHEDGRLAYLAGGRRKHREPRWTEPMANVLIIIIIESINMH